jgi:hypothetical protein
MIFYVCVELIPTRNTSKSMMVWWMGRHFFAFL